MFKGLLILLSFLATTAFADNYYAYAKKGDFLKVEELFIEYRKYESYRNPYYPSGKDDWTHTGEFHYTVSIFERLYWDNNFHISMDNTPQVRHGGWEYYVGFRVFPWFHIVKFHHSEHSFDQKQSHKFPIEDSYGIRIYFKQK